MCHMLGLAHQGAAMLGGLFAPIGFVLELLCGCDHTSLRREVVASRLLLSSGVTASALILLALVSITVRKVTFVQIARSLWP